MGDHRPLAVVHGTLTLHPGSAGLLRRLSVEFVTESQNAREPDCPPPWTDIAEGHNRTTISRKVSQAFRALIMSKEDAP